MRIRLRMYILRFLRHLRPAALGHSRPFGTILAQCLLPGAKRTLSERLFEGKS